MDKVDDSVHIDNSDHLYITSLHIYKNKAYVNYVQCCSIILVVLKYNNIYPNVNNR